MSEIIGPRRLNRAETNRSIWSYVVPEDIPYTHTFEVDFWRRSCEQLRAGDRIEVMTSDRRIQFDIFVLDSNFQADPPRVDLCWRAVYPPDLKMPDPVVAAQRWKVKQRSTDGAWFIWDDLKDEVIADGLRREAAMQQVALLEKLAKEQAAAADAAAPVKAKAAADETLLGGWYEAEPPEPPEPRRARPRPAA